MRNEKWKVKSKKEKNNYIMLLSNNEINNIK